MSNFSKGILVVIVLVLLVLGLSFWAKSSMPTEPVGEMGTIKIGFIAPLTGEAAAIGTVNRAAVELATEEINSIAGGQRFEIVYEDGQCNATKATNAAQKLINIDKVVAILGGTCSTETSAFGPMAMTNKVIVISHSSSAPSLSNLGKYFFRSYPSDLFQGKFAAEYVYNTLNAKKVAILHHNNDWGTGIKDVFVERFTELGGEITLVEGASQDSRDYRTALSKIKTSNPDLIYMPTYPEGGIVAIRQAWDLGIRTKIMGGDAWDDPKLWKEVVDRGDLEFSVVSSSLGEDFKAKILTKTQGTDITVGTSNAYDNMKLIAQAIGRVGIDPDKLADELRQTDYNGVSGHISFDQNGDLQTASYIVKRIAGGTTTEVK